MPSPPWPCLCGFFTLAQPGCVGLLVFPWNECGCLEKGFALVFPEMEPVLLAIHPTADCKSDSGSH